ncbi:MAG: ElyC/SanA/YdcF family protein [Catalinimonas sp.]
MLRIKYLRLQRHLLRGAAWGLGVVVVVCLLTNLWIILSTRHQVYHHADTLPANDVGLVLGTSQWYADGRPNGFFHQRIRTAAELYRLGKVRHLIVSGDNGSRHYNEPAAMRRALMKQGVPASAITLDYAGFRTLDSVVRCKKVFGQDSVTIISQGFHDFRAVFIGDYYRMDAVAYAAPAPADASSKTAVREVLARTKAVLDLYLLDRQPRFLGDREEIDVQ